MVATQTQTTHKNFKGVEKTVFGRGSFSQLDEILAPHRVENEGYFVFLVDNYFKGKPLEGQVPAHVDDVTYYISVEEHEPTTAQIDQLRDEILATKGLPAGVVGIGGGEYYGHRQSPVANADQRRVVDAVSGPGSN